MNKRSLFLNDKWDITLDSAGNPATTGGLYCDAQDVANAIRLFTRDAFLAQTQGVPHFELDLGRMPALSEVRSWYRKTAVNVENIRSAGGYYWHRRRDTNHERYHHSDKPQRTDIHD